MPEILIVGGGVVGMGLGMMLAEDGHEVTMLERDEQPPPDAPESAWDAWERRGVNQFRLSHLFLAQYRRLVEGELPQVAAALDRDGALRFNPLTDAPTEVTGGFREGDDRFEMLTGRRAVVERAVASVAEETPRLILRRGVAVEGLVRGKDAAAGVPHVSGILAGGEQIEADLVVDCSGRRSALPRWLESVGAQPPVDELEDSGFVYLGRHFRSRDGERPVALGPALQPYGSISVLTLPADNGTWSVTLIVRSGDRALGGLRDPDRWEKVVRELPTAAHWLDGEPLEDQVALMSKIEDRHRELNPDGRPVATGVVAVADAWACTNPSLGRGASIGMLHSQALRDLLRDTPPDHPAEFSEAFAASTARVVEPWYRATLSFDRGRLAEMTAAAEGGTYDPDDPTYEVTRAFALASRRDPDVFRAMLDVSAVLETPHAVFSRPGVFEKVMEYGADWRDEPSVGPDRDELLALSSS